MLVDSSRYGGRSIEGVVYICLRSSGSIGIGAQVLVSSSTTRFAVPHFATSHTRFVFLFIRLRYIYLP